VSPQDIAKDAIRLVTTAGLGKDVIDLLETKVALLTEKITTLEQENTNLTTKVRELEQELANAPPKQGALDETSVKFLQLLFTHEELTIRRIANTLGIAKGVAEYHKDLLWNAEMIHPFGNEIVGDFGDPGEVEWGLIAKGRAYLVENRLIS
jgi:hypothetical protein